MSIPPFPQYGCVPAARFRFARQDHCSSTMPIRLNLRLVRALPLKRCESVEGAWIRQSALKRWLLEGERNHGNVVFVSAAIRRAAPAVQFVQQLGDLSGNPKIRPIFEESQ